MPTFETISIPGAQARSATGKRAALMREYADYIQRVPRGEAGVLWVEDGETTQVIRRRLIAAADALGKRLEVHRSSDAVYFWTTPDTRRRGRFSRRNTLADTLRDYVGVLHSSEHGSGGDNLSRNTGERFAAGLFERYQRQHESA